MVFFSDGKQLLKRFFPQNGYANPHLPHASVQYTEAQRDFAILRAGEAGIGSLRPCERLLNGPVTRLLFFADAQRRRKVQRADAIAFVIEQIRFFYKGTSAIRQIPGGKKVEAVAKLLLRGGLDKMICVEKGLEMVVVAQGNGAVLNELHEAIEPLVQVGQKVLHFSFRLLRKQGDENQHKGYA